MVDSVVVRNTKQPAGETTVRVERGELEVRLDERVLRKVFRSCAVALVSKDLADQADDRTLIAADDPFERGLRSGEGFSDEPVFGYRLEVDRDGPGTPLSRSLRSIGAPRCGGCRLIISRWTAFWPVDSVPCDLRRPTTAIVPLDCHAKWE
jgi:hypothetical protein